MSRPKKYDKKSSSPHTKTFLTVSGDKTPEEYRALADDIAARYNCPFLARGPYAFFIFSFQNYRMLIVDDSIETITGVKATELIRRPFNETVGRLIVPEHIFTVNRFEEISFREMSEARDHEISLSMEYDIDVIKIRTRLLVQYQPVLYNAAGLPLLVAGYLSDVSHLGNGRPSTMTVVCDGKLKSLLVSTKDEILAGLGYHFSATELSALEFKKRGFRAKEIAYALKLKEMTVNSIFRDIKKKTSQEILPLIQYLTEKGVI